ncbi:PIN domain-containing protein [Halapricum desulfuricans]|nr:hypothetical protein [Halapricum desulfuricans]
MIALDTSFLLDYLDGVEATAAFLDEQALPLSNCEEPWLRPIL